MSVSSLVWHNKIKKYPSPIVLIPYCICIWTSVCLWTQAAKVLRRSLFYTDLSVNVWSVKVQEVCFVILQKHTFYNNIFFYWLSMHNVFFFAIGPILQMMLCTHVKPSSINNRNKTLYNYKRSFKTPELTF